MWLGNASCFIIVCTCIPQRGEKSAYFIIWDLAVSLLFDLLTKNLTISSLSHLHRSCNFGEIATNGLWDNVGRPYIRVNKLLYMITHIRTVWKYDDSGTVLTVARRGHKNTETDFSVCDIGEHREESQCRRLSVGVQHCTCHWRILHDSVDFRHL